MRHEIPSREFFIDNREKFTEKLEKTSIAYFYSGEEQLRNGDVHYDHRVDNSFFYLTGIEKQNCKLLICPEYDRYKVALFIPDSNPERAVWEGQVITKEEAKEISGIETVMNLSDFDSQFARVQSEANSLYVKLSGARKNHSVTSGFNFVDWIRYNYPALNFKKSRPILAKLRTSKKTEEINLMRKAIEITNKGFRAVIAECKPDIYEFDLQATFSYIFTKNRSMRYGYAPIIACGRNAATLHYVANNEKLKDGELLLMDVGAEYANYTADITRVIPVNGKFSARQRMLYQGLLDIEKEVIAFVKPGILLKDLQDLTLKLTTEFLKKVGLIKEDKDVKKYYMHNVSHFLGLSVHDIGIYSETIDSGAIITVEPGIYIPEEGIGLRIEDDILVTETGFDNLSKDIPKEIDEIEMLMSK